jgi:hypothetical protein
MKRTVHRTYHITRDEVRDAIYEWLRAKDIPVPDSSDLLMFTDADEVQSEVELTFRDEIAS